MKAADDKSEPRAADALLAVARLIRPHGIRGEISALVFVPSALDPAELLIGKRFQLRRAPASPGALPAKAALAKPPDESLAGRKMECESARQHQDRWLIKLAGIDSMNDAEGLRGYDLCLPRKELPMLPDGWHWEADLVGARVFDARLGEIGVAEELEFGGGQDQLLMRRTGDTGAERGARVRIPWVKAYVKTIDVEKKEIRLELPEGFPGIED